VLRFYMLLEENICIDDPQGCLTLRSLENVT
jgi:hypothetical protein